MNAENSQLLAQLKDIHSAGDPGWWPPAPGWWVLALVLLLVCVFLLRLLVNKLAVIRRRKEWMRALDSLKQDYDPCRDPHGYLAALNRLFRVIALKAFPDTACVRLQGQDWVSFIVSQMPEHTVEGSLSVLANGPYEALPEFDAPALDESVRTWVRLYG